VRERAPGLPGDYTWRRFEDLSPVVRSLAREQFDDLVKRVRIFAAPAVRDAVACCPNLETAILEAAAG
jgi:hypothetical protein